MKRFLLMITLTGGIVSEAAGQWHVFGGSNRSVSGIFAGFGLGCAFGFFLGYYARYRYKPSQQRKKENCSITAVAPSITSKPTIKRRKSFSTQMVRLDDTEWCQNFYGTGQGTNSVRGGEGISVTVDVGKRIEALKAFVTGIERAKLSQPSVENQLESIQSEFPATIHNLINLVDKCALLGLATGGGEPSMFDEYLGLQWKASALLRELNHSKSDYLAFIYPK